MENFEHLLKRYDYRLPPDFIAQAPVRPRDAAKLLVYDRVNGVTKADIFKNIGKYLPRGTVLVFNQTKVLPARLALRKESGAIVKILYISTEDLNIRALANKHLGVGERLELNFRVYFTVLDKENGAYILKPSFAVKGIYKVLMRYGETPIPPYIKHSPLKEVDLRQEYQTIFAKDKGSVAAPTAALHFTTELFARLRRSGFVIKFITLHVNLGTFAPLKEANFKTGKLHREFFNIDRRTAGFLSKAKKDGRPIVAVGTTVARTLESASNSRGLLNTISGVADLFIREGYKFKFMDALVTNFHVPKSSLLMLVAAFIGSRPKLFSLYAKAIKKKIRFFSFGDGMLIK